MTAAMTRRALALSLLALAGVAAVPARAATLPSDPAKLAAFEEINNFRKKNGRAPLAYNARLEAAAQWLAADMRAKGYFDHIDSNGHDPGWRITSAGYGWRACGENIAAGQATWHAAMASWKKSPGHRANLLSTAFKEVGLGSAAGGRYGTYWVQDFGTQR